MALLYPWATKEYLLWKMSLAQIILYHNIGIEQKYGKRESGPPNIKEMTHEDRKRLRDELRRQYGEIGGEDDNG